MERWQQSLLRSDDALRRTARRLGVPEERIRRVAASFRVRATPYYLSLIREVGDPIYLQCFPDDRELADDPALLDDPLGEETHALCPGVVKRYPDRCMLYVSNECAAYCRFCTRKRLFRAPSCPVPACPVPGAQAPGPVPEAQAPCPVPGAQAPGPPPSLHTALSTIAAHPEIRDVLVSGGDPFLLPDDRLDDILTRLRAIPHVEIIRIGTRTPCTLPERITAKLVRMLKKHHPLFVNVHFNHPRELTPESTRALARLADAGIPLGSQTVLLKGVNDDPATMKALMHGLLRARVRPYYLFHCDLVYGTSHFRVPVSRGLEIIRSLRCFTSGLAVPHYVIDLPHGRGKVALAPDPVVRREGSRLFLRTYLDDICEYPDVPE